MVGEHRCGASGIRETGVAGAEVTHGERCRRGGGAFILAVIGSHFSWVMLRVLLSSGRTSSSPGLPSTSITPYAPTTSTLVELNT
ncbi:hypothetical protein EYF80_012335 [Liparis tanakae]|uniref:Uncharacterized protein n=1 Tax=Liparis tanakae TaxID=230148 RepID=A0A4Z2IIG9_9TELE|nr:hypothetical protein EYF80_012335 [Liparis tanakae]